MGTTAHQIASHIERTRHELGSNINELEQKVKSVTDWRRQFEAHPMTLLGLAFGGGVLLASMFSGGNGSRTKRRVNDSDTTHGDRRNSRASDAWDGIKGALIGVAASRLMDFVDGVLPGFKEHMPAQGGPAKSASNQRAGLSSERLPDRM